MAEGNGDISGDLKCNVERTEDFQKLITCGLDEKVAAKLDDIYKTGKLTHADLDERALDALKEFPIEGALIVLTQFLDANLEHVSNKSAYLCGVMKTYRQKNRAGQAAAPPTTQTNAVKAPDEDKIKAILDRTGYTLDVTTGQRKYGGPPPDWKGSAPGNGCEVFCGKIPKDMYEDELIPLFEKCGTIWDLRLMMDPMSGQNRGYAFVTFATKDSAQQAVRELDNYEIKPSKSLKVNISVPNLRLFVGNIPKSKGKDEILEEFNKSTAGLTQVIIYSSPDDKKKNRGFCFLEYESHKAASLAKRRLGSGRIKVWGCDIIVDWADPQEEPDESTMSKVKVLYVRNLTQDCSEDKMKESFEQFGKVERVKKIKDYAFVHFEERDSAVKAMEELNGKDIVGGGSAIEVSLAKPPSDKKKKEEMLRNRERRMMQMMQLRGGMIPTPIPMRGPGGSGPRNSAAMRGGPMGRGDYDYDYEYFGYGDYRGGYSDPYYDDYYRYEDYYYDYPPAPPARGRSRQPQPAGRGRGATAGTAGTAGRGRGGGPGQGPGPGPGPARGGQGPGASRGGRPPGASGARGGARSGGPARGQGRGKGSLSGEDGKRKFDGSHQNQGETKRRYQNPWANSPSNLNNAYNSGMNGSGADPQFFHDTFTAWS